jgi:predicted Zn-dependent peptidase
MPFHATRLPNGLEIVAETMPTAKSAAVGFFVRTGARDESAPESGVSHFLEHMLFKGTPRRSALDVNLDFDRIGANYNAYTSEELTVYYAAVLPEYLPKAVDVLTDILRPSLRNEDFDTEKQVILEEIGMYDDMPGFAASDLARKLYFNGHPLGNSVLGTAESVTALKRDAMMDYFSRRYGAANILVAAAGAFDFGEFEQLIRKHCAGWEPGRPGRENIIPTRGGGGTHVHAKPGVSQEHVLCIGPGPAAEDPLRYASAVLALAEPGHVESISCGAEQNQGNGAYASTFSCEPAKAGRNAEAVRKILGTVQNHNITSDELNTAKAKIASRLVRGVERPMGRMRSVAGAWLYNREEHDPDRELARFDALTLADTRACLDAFPLDAITTVAYGPLEGL